MPKPVIAITVAEKNMWISKLCLGLAVWLAGGKPYFLSANSNAQWHLADGFILAGGTDVFPPLYGHMAKKDYLYDHRRDQFEQLALEQAMQRNKPVLGICRGAQMMNVWRNGSLHIDIAKVYEKATYPSGLWARVFYRKVMHVLPNTLLAQVMGTGAVRVNSMHTQAVDRLGEGLKINSVENNGVVQGVELPGQDFFLGVQFHPEFMIYHKKFRCIFERLVEEAHKKIYS